LKHDFSTYNLLGWNYTNHLQTEGNWKFYDNTKTNAQILKTLYQTIEDAMGDGIVIGCGVHSHLAAGIHEIHRSGCDTSGRDWEITRRMGINTLAFRLPQNGAFYTTDADCACFTEKVPIEQNLQFMELIAMSGTALFASITPGLLSSKQLERAAAAYRISAQADYSLKPLDWMDTNCPTTYQYKDQIFTYDWYSDTDGVYI